MSAAALAAALAHQRMLQEEEQSMSQYTPEQLTQYEFKILRANTAAFRNPETFNQACLEEAANGWSLVEKFDNYRLRFKRPISARTTPSTSAIDPYRTTYGTSKAALVALTLFLVLGGSLLFTLCIKSLVEHH